MKEITKGAIIYEPQNTYTYLTGGWRTFRPVINYEKCIRCYICWTYCPEPAIFKRKPAGEPVPNERVAEKDVVYIDYDHCKGCGICVAECPVKAIEFVKEEK